MANIDDKNKDINSANLFDDDFFGSNSSNDLFGSSDDFFNTSSNDIFSSTNNSMTNNEEEKKEDTITIEDIENNTQEESSELLINNQEYEELDGYYDDNGYYWYNNGTYYDANGLYHDLEGNVIDEEGNILETNVPLETPPQNNEVPENLAEGGEKEQSEEITEEQPEIDEIDKTGEKVKNKSKKQKNKKEKKKHSLLTKLIICGIVLFLLLGGGAFCGIKYYKKISVKLDTPILKIEKMYNKVIFEATEIEKAEGYEFVVSIDDGRPITLKSRTNKKELDVTNYRKIVVKVRCLGKIGKAHSNYSAEQTLSNKIQLNMSTVFVDGLTEIKDGQNVISYKTNDNISDDIISWESVKNASKYYLYYKVDIDKDEVKKYEVEQTDGTVVFNLSKIYQENGAGCYNISVVAIPGNEEYYEISEYSDIKVVEYYTQQEKIIDAELNKESKLLTIYTDLVFKASKISLTFNYGIIAGVVDLQLIVEDLIKEEVIHNGKSALKFTVDVSEFVKDEVEGISIIVLGDGKYSTNSDSYTLQ